GELLRVLVEQPFDGSSALAVAIAGEAGPRLASCLDGSGDVARVDEVEGAAFLEQLQGGGVLGLGAEQLARPRRGDLAPYGQRDLVASAGRGFKQRWCGSYNDGRAASCERVGAVIGEAVEAVHAAHDDVVTVIVCGWAGACSFADADEV